MLESSFAIGSPNLTFAAATQAPSQKRVKDPAKPSGTNKAELLQFNDVGNGQLAPSGTRLFNGPTKDTSITYRHEGPGCSGENVSVVRVRDAREGLS